MRTVPGFALLVFAIHCDPDPTPEPGRADCSNTAATLNATATGTGQLVVGGQTTEATSGGVYVHLGRTSTPTGKLLLGWEGRTRVEIRLFALDGAIPTSKVGDRFSKAAPADVILNGRETCPDHPTLQIDIDVVEARGTVDLRQHTIDRTFLRTFKITFDWPNVACGVERARGEITFSVTSADLVHNCADLYTLIPS